MYYLSVDLEMTGNEPGWHEIIQIGAVLCDEDFNEIDSFESLVYPENEESFSTRAEAVHGITLAELDEAPMQYEVLEDFESWLMQAGGFRNKGQLKSVVMCGQSVVYDINFLRFAYRKEKMKWPFSFTSLDLHGLTFLLFQILRQNGQETPRQRNLDTVAEFFGLGREELNHDALEDARITAQCFKEVFKLSKRMKIEPASE